MGGYQLTDPALGLFVQVGQAGLNIAYCNGYELKQTNAVFAPLVDTTTNYIYLHFTKTVDPGGGYSAITLDITVNQTGIDPGDAIKLGEVDTAAGVITFIREENNKYRIHTAQLDENIDGNLKSINRLVVQGGFAFPTVPAPIAGELFYRTDLAQLYYFDGVLWQPITPGGAPGVVQFFAGAPVAIGEVVYMSPVPNTILPAIASAMATAEALGAATAPILPGPTGPVMTGHGIPVPTFCENGLALLPGQKVWLSKTLAGAVTNIPPANPTARKVLGVISDPSMYVTIVNPYATVVWAPEPTIWVP